MQGFLLQSWPLTRARSQPLPALPQTTPDPHLSTAGDGGVHKATTPTLSCLLTTRIPTVLPAKDWTRQTWKEGLCRAPSPSQSRTELERPQRILCRTLLAPPIPSPLMVTGLGTYRAQPGTCSCLQLPYRGLDLWEAGRLRGETFTVGWMKQEE